MRSFEALPEAGPDELDGRHPHSNNTVEAHASSSSAYKPHAKDLQLINKMVDDPHTSPSKYHSSAEVRSNIPSERPKPKDRGYKSSNHRSHTPRSYREESYGEDIYANGYIPTSARAQKAMTPRSGDLLDQHEHKFNRPEEPFKPRTLKTKNKTQSRISTMKCYTAPKKATTPREEVQEERQQEMKETRTAPPKPAPRDRRGSVEGLRSTKGSVMSRGQSRPETPYSEADLMNETLMSRDGSQIATPAGVPALDISLDADHVKWLKEQTRKAHVRKSSARSRSEVDELGSTWGSQRSQRSQRHGRTQALGESRTLGETQQHMNGTYDKPMTMSGTYEGGRQHFTLSGSIKSTG